MVKYDPATKTYHLFDDAVKNSSAQSESDTRTLEVAVMEGVLPRSAGVKDLTPEVRGRLCDIHLLRHAIATGYLIHGAGVDDLITEVRARMLKNGNLKQFFPDGTVNDRLHDSNISICESRIETYETSNENLLSKG